MKRKILPYKPYLKPIANKLRKQMTLSEVLLWNTLKQKKMLGMDFDRQRPILNYIVDFYCKDLMLAIEVDGSSHDNKWEKDQFRQQELEQAGVRFLRFTDYEVKKDIQGVLRVIEDWVEDAIKKEGYAGRVTHP
ncbi:MAG: endonuclease domain-containing protein [Bacteroidales bacterium]